MACDFLMVQRYENIVLAKVMKERLLDAASITSAHNPTVIAAAIMPHLHQMKKTNKPWVSNRPKAFQFRCN